MKRRECKRRKPKNKNSVDYMRRKLKKYLKQQRRFGRKRTEEEISIKALLYLEKAILVNC